MKDGAEIMRLLVIMALPVMIILKLLVRKKSRSDNADKSGSDGLSHCDDEEDDNDVDDDIDIDFD